MPTCRSHGQQKIVMASSSETVIDEFIEQEKTLCDLVSWGVDFLFKTFQPDQKVLLCGSVVERAFLLRYFKEHKTSCEIDLMFFSGSLPNPCLIEEIQGKYGFVKIKRDTSGASNFVPMLQPSVCTEGKAPDNLVEDTSIYIRSEQIKRETKKGIEYTMPDDSARIMAEVLDLPAEAIRIDRVSDISGPSAYNEWTIQIKKKFESKSKSYDDPLIKVSVDHVAAIRCNFWPEIANDWVMRDRKWPTKDVIERIQAKGCHLVPKNADLDDITQWRWSFSEAEAELAKAKNDLQFKCYFLFKCLFYAHLKIEGDGKVMSSYLVKTVMFWYCERHDVKEWTTDNTEVMLKELLQELRRCITERHMSNFFIPQMNVLDGYPDALLVEADAKIALLEVDPYRHLPAEDQFQQLIDFCNFVKEHVNLVKVAEVAFKVFQENSSQ